MLIGITRNLARATTACRGGWSGVTPSCRGWSFSARTMGGWSGAEPSGNGGRGDGGGGHGGGGGDAEERLRGGRVVVVVNPNAGGKRNGLAVLKSKVAPAVAEGRAGGGGSSNDCNYDDDGDGDGDSGRDSESVVVTEGQGHAERVMARMDLTQTELIVVVGGDGTVNEVANGVAKRGDAEGCLARIRFAVVPTGSGNAVALDLHDADGRQGSASELLERAVAALRGWNDANVVQRDVLTLEFADRHDGPVQRVRRSVAVFSWGFHAALVAGSDSWWLRRLGNIRFQLAAGVELLRFHAFAGELQLTGCVEYTRRDGAPDDVAGEPRTVVFEAGTGFRYLLVTKVRQLERGFPIGLHTDGGDGLLDVVAITDVSRSDLLAILSTIQKRGAMAAANAGGGGGADGGARVAEAVPPLLLPPLPASLRYFKARGFVLRPAEDQGPGGWLWSAAPPFGGAVCVDGESAAAAAEIRGSCSSPRLSMSFIRDR